MTDKVPQYGRNVHLTLWDYVIILIIDHDSRFMVESTLG